MHAFLIVGNNSEQEVTNRITAWKISSWDTIRTAQEGTVGIEMVRDFKHNLSLIPRNSPAKVGVITQMERLTVEAQNALLKILEEPPPNTYLIGTTGMPEALLPTILSRMNIVRGTDTPEIVDAALLSILELPIGKRLAQLEKYTMTRNDANKFVTDLLAAAHQELLAHPSPKITTLIRNLLAARQQLSVNVNQKLVIDNAVL